jgi:Yip1 domain
VQANVQEALAMEIDLKETLKLVKGGLLDHRATWQNYLDQEPAWQKTAGILTAPILVFNVLLTQIFARVLGGSSAYGYSSNIIVALLMGLIMSAVGIALASFVLAFLAGNFGGKNSFSRGLAAVSLAAIPGAVAGVVGAFIPGLGFLITLAGGILSLVFLYKILPLALDVPEEKRTVHFVVSLLCLFVLNVVLATVLGLGGSGRAGSPYSGADSSAGGGIQTSGFLGEIQRQSQLIETAGADTYDPPANGKLTDEQLRGYIKVKEKTRAAHERYARKVQELEKEMEDKENPSLADMSKIYSGLGGAFSANNAEMEIVMTGGGNWAEHQWISSTLRTAMLQQGDGSEAQQHNYSLYEKYREDLEE